MGGRRQSASNFASRIGRRVPTVFSMAEAIQALHQVSQDRVRNLSSDLTGYIDLNMIRAVDNRTTLASYRINPYVIIAAAGALQLDESEDFAKFLVHSKFYAGLETSFGKSIEQVVLKHYPVEGNSHWEDPPEKIVEFASYDGLSAEERTRARNNSVWREIDKSCVVDNRRYLVSVKSGPDTINDTQVEAMRQAISTQHRKWLQQSRETYPEVTGIDIVIGLTYGTNKRTNNKENQILTKLLSKEFVEEDPVDRPGVLIDKATQSVRVYRVIGKRFWSFIAAPNSQHDLDYPHHEVLLALAKSVGFRSISDAGSLHGVEEALEHEAADISPLTEIPAVSRAVQSNIKRVASEVGAMTYPRNQLPQWIQDDYSESEISWVVAALSAFYDQ